MSKTSVKNAHIVRAYLSGNVIEFTETKKPTEDSQWRDVYPYEEISDVFRLSNKEYSFRIKPK